MATKPKSSPSSRAPVGVVFSRPSLAILAGLLGAIGVGLAAAAAHLTEVRALSAAAHLALAHAPALLVIAATRLGLSRLGLMGGWVMGVGTLTFVIAVTAKPLGGIAFLAPAAPYGGSLVILGWLILAAAGVVGLIRRP
jgi:uncharacterized membrane protein YgdD (TMEM256/DUF423 family)